MVEAVHWMMNHCSASTRSSFTWTSPSTPWIASTTFIPLSPSHIICVAPCASYLPPQAAFALIYPALDIEAGEYELLYVVLMPYIQPL